MNQTNQLGEANFKAYLSKPQETPQKAKESAPHTKPLNSKAIPGAKPTKKNKTQFLSIIKTTYNQTYQEYYSKSKPKQNTKPNQETKYHQKNYLS